jgi:anthranilate phosphoribosyltransferase
MSDPTKPIGSPGNPNTASPRIDGGSGSEDLSADAMEQAVDAMLDDRCSADDFGRLLLRLREKGESVSELVGAARALRKRMTKIACPYPILLDTCGTGGDGSGTFNISTAAAIVIAAAGVPVAKHGNRKITSLTGSADVLFELGVQIDASQETVERSLAETGLCFCFAPRLHPAMAKIAVVRRQLGVPTLFNYLGPLCNPASATHQILGVGRPGIQTKLALAIEQLGTRGTLVVRGDDGLDEITLADPTTAIHLDGQSPPQNLRWNPADFGVSKQSLQSIHVDGPAQSAAMIQQVLAGTQGTARDVVLVNAAAPLWLVGKAANLREAMGMAAFAIDSGAAKDTLKRLAHITATG